MHLDFSMFVHAKKHSERFLQESYWSLFSIIDLETISAMDLNVLYTENISINNTSLFSDSRNITLLPYYQHSLLVATVFILAYMLIFSLCMLGNLLVCFIVLKNRQMRTVTNIFILNLAISDLLVGILCLPITLVDNLITGTWSFHFSISLHMQTPCCHLHEHSANHLSRRCHVTHHSILQESISCFNPKNCQLSKLFCHTQSPPVLLSLNDSLDCFIK